MEARAGVGARNSDAEIEAVMASLAKEPDVGLVVMPDFYMFNHIEQITSLAAQNRVPAIYPWKFVSYPQKWWFAFFTRPQRYSSPRGLASVDRVLRGGKPADLPVQVPVKLSMAINAKTGKHARPYCAAIDDIARR